MSDIKFPLLVSEAEHAVLRALAAGEAIVQADAPVVAQILSEVEVAALKELLVIKDDILALVAEAKAKLAPPAPPTQ